MSTGSSAVVLASSPVSTRGRSGTIIRANGGLTPSTSGDFRSGKERCSDRDCENRTDSVSRWVCCAFGSMSKRRRNPDGQRPVLWIGHPLGLVARREPASAVSTEQSLPRLICRRASSAPLRPISAGLLSCCGHAAVSIRGLHPARAALRPSVDRRSLSRLIMCRKFATSASGRSNRPPRRTERTAAGLAGREAQGPCDAVAVMRSGSARVIATPRRSTSKV